MSKKDWIWMPHPGHFIAASHCQFRMNTYVNGYIISTIGEYQERGGKILQIGVDRTYETMVFKAMRKEDDCCPYGQESGTEIDFASYYDARSAFNGHLKLCEKYDNKKGG